MLPSLVSLTLDNPGLIPTLPLLLSPTLRTISFCNNEDDHFSNRMLYPLHKGFMRIISEQAPSIKKLVLPGLLFNRESYNLILNLRNLHTLIIATSEIQSGNVPLDIISFCASIVELKMYFGPNDATSVTPPNLKFRLPCFQSLRPLGSAPPGSGSTQSLPCSPSYRLSPFLFSSIVRMSSRGLSQQMSHNGPTLCSVSSSLSGRS